ncbi:MAG: substrate-binding domain-containing protein [Solirubrobacterales bacterium]
MHTKNTFAAVVVALATMVAAAPSFAGELRVTGAAAVANTIVVPNKAAIEKDTGLTLAVTVNGDGNGLKDLVAGKSDIMMVAAPLKTTEAVINKAAPGSVSADGLQMTQIGAVSIKFVVNPANPVKTLSDAQLKDILTGKIANWKEVGGADLPIMVIAEAPGFGTRSNVEASFLGTEVTDKARIVQALVQVTQVVAQAPNAIGYGNAASISGGGVAVLPGAEVKQPLGFATKGAPSADAKKLIDAAAKYASAVK